MKFHRFTVLSSYLFLSATAFQSYFRQPRNFQRNESRIWKRQLSLDNTFIAPEADDDRDEAILSRWEQMYFEAEQAEKGKLLDESIMLRSPVRVVTFDLDNTLWKTKYCIGAANDALAAYLDKYNIQQPKRVEKIMGDLFQGNKKAYAPKTENATSPVLLTELRIDALKEVLKSANGYSEEAATAFASKAFGCWTTARHDAIPENYADDVLGCLKKISNMRTAGNHPILVGAITDGNSDPRNVDELREYFDFCVNAESVGVSKPDKRVYLEAVRQVVSHPNFQDLGRKTSDSEDDLEDIVGQYWVHIGDDFSKDIVAAKSMKMRTIWAQELIRDKLPKANIDRENRDDRSVEEFVKEVSEKEVIEMSIGAGDYLANFMAREFADHIASTFAEVSEILSIWNQDATKKGDTADSALEVTIPEATIVPSEENSIPLFGGSDFVVSTVASRTFRLTRSDCSMDVPAPFKNREEQKMQDVMAMAQLEKSSGVFSFPPDEVEQLQKGEKVLMVEIGSTGIKFSREIFSGMAVDEVLNLSDENPMTLNLFMQEAVDSPSFDLF